MWRITATAYRTQCRKNLLANCQVFGTWELGDFHSEDSVWICHTVCFFMHKVNINDLTNFHVSYSCIKSSDHLACAADEFLWQP